MALEDKLLLRYSGETVGRGIMDARMAADALIGFSIFIDRIGKEVYGDSCRVRSNISDFRSGSAEFQFLLEIINADLDGSIFTALSAPKGLFDFVRDCFDLYKHLMGEPPKSQKGAQDGGVYVENNHGEIKVFNGAVVNVVADETTGKAVEKFVRNNVKKEGDNLDIIYHSDIVSSINDEESKYFKRLPQDELLAEYTADMGVRIAVPVLEGNIKWRFHDGSRIFSAVIEDQEFLEKVANGNERFGTGDILHVRMRCIQRRDQNKLHPEYFIEEIYEHEVYKVRQKEMKLDSD